RARRTRTLFRRLARASAVAVRPARRGRGSAPSLSRASPEELLPIPGPTQQAMSSRWLLQSGGGGEVVGATSCQPGPLGRRASISPSVGAVDLKLLWPAGRRGLPRLLTSVDGEVHERQAVVHCLYAAAGGPVRFENPVAVT